MLSVHRRVPRALTVPLVEARGWDGAPCGAGLRSQGCGEARRGGPWWRL